MKISDNHYLYRLETQNEDGSIVDFQEVETVEPLRSVGDIHDELDLENNKQIKRIEEIVFTGDSSEYWYNDDVHTTDTHFVAYMENIDLYCHIEHHLCETDRNLFEFGDVHVDENKNFFCTSVESNGMNRIYISIAKSELAYTVYSHEALKEYFKDNPTTVWYVLRYPIEIPRLNAKGYVITHNGSTTIDAQPQTTGKVIPIVKATIEDTVIEMDSVPTMTINNTDEGNQITDLTFEGVTLVNNAKADNIKGTKEVSHTRYDFAPFYDGQTTINNTIEGGYVSAKLYGDTMINIAKTYGETDLLTMTDDCAIVDLLGDNADGVILADGEITEGRIYGDSVKGENPVFVDGRLDESTGKTNDVAGICCHSERAEVPKGTFTFTTGYAWNKVAYYTDSGSFIKCDVTSNPSITSAPPSNASYVIYGSDNTLQPVDGFTWKYEDGTDVYNTIQSVVNPCTIFLNNNFTDKNLFNKDTVTVDYVLNTSTGEPSIANGGYSTSDFILVAKEYNYIVVNDNCSEICFYDLNKNFISSISRSFTPTQNGYIRFVYNNGSINRVMFGSFSSTNPTYTEYQQLDIQQATFPYTLNKLPNGVADYIDVVNGVYVQRVGRIENPSDLRWNIWINSPLSDGTPRIVGALYESLAPQGIPKNVFLSDRLIWKNSMTDDLSIYYTSNNIFITFLNINTMEKFNEKLASLNPKILYELKTPIYTPLTDEEKALLPLSAYANGYIQLSSDELRPSKFEFRAKSSNRMQLDMLETGHYYLNAPTGNVKLGNVDINVTEMPCLINVDNASNNRLVVDGGTIDYNLDINSENGYLLDSGQVAVGMGKDRTSDYIKINSRIILLQVINVSNITSWKHSIAYYDENKIAIQTTLNIYLTQEKTIITSIPNNAVYCRISMQIANIIASNSNAMITISTPITLAKLPSHRIPTTFTQGMKSSVDFGYWEGSKEARAVTFRTTYATGNWDIVDAANINNGQGIVLNRAVLNGKIIEDELDISTGKYIKRIEKITVNGSENWTQNTGGTAFVNTNSHYTPLSKRSYGYDCCSDKLKFRAYWSADEPRVWIDGREGLVIHLPFAVSYNTTVLKQYLSENPITVYYELETPEISYLELPTNAPKTVADKTALQCMKYSNDNLFAQCKPAPLSYPTTLSPNTQYTVFHNRKNYNGSVKTPMINLGGTEVVATGSRTVVTTPSTLAHNELQFIGGENTVEQVMVVHGDWTKEGKTVDYFEGLQSSIIGDKTLENLIDKPINIVSNNVTKESNGGVVDYVSMDDIVAGYGNRPKLPEVQVDTNVHSCGMTLQNLASLQNITKATGELTAGQSKIGCSYNLKNNMLKIGGQYTVICEVKVNSNTNTYIYNELFGKNSSGSGLSHGFTLCKANETGTFKKVSYISSFHPEALTTDGMSGYVACRTEDKTQPASYDIELLSIIILEGDYTNMDIPYFEGMKSVENPILTTTGKNLFDINSMSNINNWDTVVSSEIPYCSYKINLKPNTTYTFSQKQFVNTENVYASFGLKKGSFEYLLAIAHPTSQYPTTLTLTTDDRGLIYVKLYDANTTLETFISKLSNNQLQLEESSTATLYEPYKSSILTVNEEVELRSVGSYKDVIGWNDGIIRRNCVEFTISGEEGYNWAFSSEKEYTMLFGLGLSNLGLKEKLVGGSNIPVICDKIPYKNDSSDTVHLRPNGVNPAGALQFWFDKSKLTNNTSQSVNDYIKSIGGLTIVAPLANTEYEAVTFTNDYSNVDEEYQVGKPLIFNHGTLYTTTDTHPSTFLDFSLKTTNRYTVKDFDKLKYTVLTEQPFNFNGVDYPSSSTGMTIVDITGIADSSIYSDDTMITVVQDDGNYYADGVLTQFKGTKTFTKEFIRTGNGTYDTGMTLLEPLELCSSVEGVRDIYNPITGTLVKRFHTFVIDDEFLDKYSWNYQEDTANNMWEIYIPNTASREILPAGKGGFSGYATPPFHYNSWGNIERICMTDNLYIKTYISNVPNKDVNLFLEYLKQYTPITVSYELETPQIIQATPISTYISTRPENGNIVAQDIQIQAEYLNYDNEQSIISPRMLGDGDEIRWEQGSQCYVYENDNEYIPLTEYNELFGANLQAQEYTQYAESVDGADIEVGVALKEKAVYEQTYVKYEDNIVYPETMENIDETNGVEVDYICGATWQNPNDLSDIRHLGELREDGQYDVTIRRSGDDEIRLLEGTTHISLDYDGTPPSEFELTFFNNGGVEVGKYGDTTHVLEDCVENSKLASGTVYGQTLVNLLTRFMSNVSYINDQYRIIFSGVGNFDKITVVNKNSKPIRFSYTVPNWKHHEVPAFSSVLVKIPKEVVTYNIIPLNTFGWDSTNYKEATDNIVLLHGDYTNVSIPYFEGIGSTVVNGFSSCGKNLFSTEYTEDIKETLVKHTVIDKSCVEVIATSGNGWSNVCFYGIPVPHTKTGDYFLTIHKSTVLQGNPYEVYILYNHNGDKQFLNITQQTVNGYTYRVMQYQDTTKLEKVNARFYCASNTQSGSIRYEDISLFYLGQTIPTDLTSYTYESPKKVSYTLPTPITLRKVGDVCDTYDVVSGKLTQRIGEIVLDGSENWGTLAKGRYCIENTLNNVNRPNVGSINFKCDKLKPITYGEEHQGTLGISLYEKNDYDFIVRTDIPTVEEFKQWLSNNPTTVQYQLATPTTTQHTLIPSTTQTTQEPTFILPQPLRSVPNGICDRLYWDENKGHYCIEKRIGYTMIDGTNKSYNYELGSNKLFVGAVNMFNIGTTQMSYGLAYSEGWKTISDSEMNKSSKSYPMPVVSCFNTTITVWIPGVAKNTESYVQYFRENPTKIYHAINPEIIDLPHLDKKVELPTQPDIYPIGYKAVHDKMNPEIGLTIPYKVLNMPTQPVNLNFVMDIADYVLTWDDVKEARHYNIILNDEVIATVKEPQYNTGEEMYGYILVEANNEIGDSVSKELYIKTVPNAPAQLTVAHNPSTDYYDFEISFIDKSAIADYYTVQYKVDGGEWIINNIENDKLAIGDKKLWSFSVYEIKESIEVWATATNDVGTNDILPSAIYYMSPTPQWTYRMNSKEVFLRWMDNSPYDVKYKLRYSYLSNGQYQYAYFEGDKEEIGKLYEAVVPLAENDEVAIALCIVSERENLYCKPVKASKELDPNIVPPLNFNYRWLARGLIEFYWQDQYDVDVEYEYILETMKGSESVWTQVNETITSTDVEGTGTVYRVEYQLEDLEQIRMKVRMKWAMNETQWTETLTTVFIPVEGNPPTYIRRTQTAEGLLVEWEAQAYIDSYHIYVIDNTTKEVLQHLETQDNNIIVDLDYSNSIELAIYEISRFSGGIESDPTDSMVFTPTMSEITMLQNIYQPCVEEHSIEVSTVQKGSKQPYVIHDVSYTPNIESESDLQVNVSTPFLISYHPTEIDVHQVGSKAIADMDLKIKTLDTRTEETVEVMTFERITDTYDMNFQVYTPSVMSYPITLEVSKVRIVCLGDSLTSGRKLSKSN